jgi:hypothetical protein
VLRPSRNPLPLNQTGLVAVTLALTLTPFSWFGDDKSVMKNLFNQGGQEMKPFKRVLIFTFIIALFILEANRLMAQEKFSVLTDKVIGI